MNKIINYSIFGVNLFFILLQSDKQNMVEAQSGVGDDAQNNGIIRNTLEKIKPGFGRQDVKKIYGRLSTQVQKPKPSSIIGSR